MIPYNEFLQAVTNDDLRMMTLIAHRQTIATQSAAEADQYFVILDRLFNAGLITRGERAWERRDGIVWQVFEATVEPLAVAYLTQLAMDRIALSRNPL